MYVNKRTNLNFPSSCLDKPPCVPNTGGYSGFQGYVNYPGYPSYQSPAVPSFQSQVVPTPPQYAANAPPAKGTSVAPVKAKPTGEKASTRRVSAEDGKDAKSAVSPQSKGYISDTDDHAEYNATEQSYAGYNARENEEMFYNNSAKHEDDKGMYPERNYSSSFTAQFTGKENTTLQQTKDEDNKKLPENGSPEKADEDKSQQKEQQSSDEHDYKDEIEKEAVEQEKEADEKAEKEGQQHDKDDNDDEEEDDDSDDNEDDDSDDNDDDDNEEDMGHSQKDSMEQNGSINNPADRLFAVSPTVVPGMCPPCREYCYKNRLLFQQAGTAGNKRVVNQVSVSFLELD